VKRFGVNPFFSNVSDGLWATRASANVLGISRPFSNYVWDKVDPVLSKQLYRIFLRGDERVIDPIPVSIRSAILS